MILQAICSLHINRLLSLCRNSCASCVLSWTLELVLPLFLSPLASAQVPPGGYVPRPVQLLEREPEPPGGLIPYRSGNMWGYADTTGKVIIAPTFRTQPDFFILGFGQVIEKNDHSEVAPTNNSADYTESTIFINASGQTLKADKNNAVVLRQDSSLHVVARRTHYLQPYVVQLLRLPDGRAQINSEVITPSNSSVWRFVPLGSNRAMGYKRQNLPAKAELLAPELLRTALFNERGRRLTGFKYAKIYPFVNGFARFERTGKGYNQAGLLNRRGKEVLIKRYNSTSDFYNNRALVNYYDHNQKATYAGIVDTSNRFVRPLQRGYMTWAVPGKKVVGYDSMQELTAVFLTSDGDTILHALKFQHVEVLPNRNIRVQCEKNQPGLLNEQLEWLIPCQPQRFQLRNWNSRETDYQEVIRAKLHGIFSTATGKPVVPLRYDTIYQINYPHFYSVRRNQHDYVLNYKGEEIAEGRLADEYYSRILDSRHPAAHLAPIVRADGRVALLDSSGRPQTGWWPFVGVERRVCLPVTYVSHGFSIICNDASLQGIADATGKLRLPMRYGNIEYRDGLYLAQRGMEYNLFDNQLNAVATVSSPQQITLLSKGWAGNEQLLVNSAGKIFPAPVDTHWNTSYVVGGYYHPALYKYGVWSTGKGFITRAGTQLWRE